MKDFKKLIAIENIRYASFEKLYKDDMSPPPKRKTIPLMQFSFLPKEKKENINDAIRKEKRHEEFIMMKEKHDKLITALEHEKALYDIKYPSKDIAAQNSDPIFHHDHTAGYSWFRHPIKSIKKWQWRTFEKETIILINMQLANGKHISFIRPISQDRFSIFGGTYIVDVKLSYFSLSANMTCLDYHQDYSLPVKRVWDIDGIKTAVENSGIIECPAATNPSNITRFLNSNIIEQIFQGAALGKMLMLIGIGIIICILAVIICTFVLNGRIEGLMKAMGK